MYGSGGGIAGGGIAGGTLAYTGADPHIAVLVAGVFTAAGVLLAARKRYLDRRYRGPRHL